MNNIEISQRDSQSAKDLSDALSAIHCLESNISVPSHLLAKFDLGVTTGLESDDDKRWFFSKIIDKIKTGWKLEIGETANLVAELANDMEQMLSGLKKRTRPSENNNNVFTANDFGSKLSLGNVPQALIFLGKDLSPKSVLELVESNSKIDIKPIKLFNVLKVDYENREVDDKGLVKITKDAKNKVIKEAEKITNSDFLDSETIRKHYKKYANNLYNPNFVVSDNVSLDNKDYELFIPLIVSNNSVTCFIRDTTDFFTFLTQRPLSLNANTLSSIVKDSKPWTINDFNDFTVELIKLNQSTIKTIKESFVGLKGLTAEKVVADLQDAENREVFINVQYVLTRGYRDMLITLYNSCASLNRLQTELYYMAKNK